MVKIVADIWHLDSSKPESDLLSDQVSRHSDNDYISTITYTGCGHLW